MKKSYPYVPKEDVTACKELARTMIKRKLTKCPFQLDEDDVTEIEYKVSSFFDAMQFEFRWDFHDWVRKELHKAIDSI